MKFFFIFFIFFSSLFFYLKTDNYKPIQFIQKNWSFDKKTFTKSSSDTRNEKFEIDFLQGFRGEDFFYNFKQNQKYKFSINERIEYALNGSYFLKYQKVAKEIIFLDSNYEILWKRKVASYPRMNYKGDLILFVSGNQDQVFILDENGNRIGKLLKGIFLTDYFFSPKKSLAFILFSNGKIYKIDRETKEIFDYQLDFDKEQLHFYKSMSVSPDIKTIAVHLINDTQDEILLLDEQMKRKFAIPFEINYPHKIYFAVSNTSYLILNLPEKLLFFKEDMKLWEYEKNTETDSKYNLAYFTGKFFIVDMESQLWFLSEDGRIIKRENIQNEGFARAIPSFSDDSVFIETQKSIYHYQLIDSL